MSILDDEITLIENSDNSINEEFTKRIMNKYPITKEFLGGYKHHGKNRVGYDCFGRPIIAGDWVVFRTKNSGVEWIDGLAFGVIKSIGKKNIKVIRRKYDFGGWGIHSDVFNDSMISPNFVFKIDDKDKFVESLRLNNE